MCRLAAYLGPEIPLADLIVRPPHSLMMQSQDAQEAKLAVNGDGFGFAWYDSYRDLAEPGLYKDIWPAWSDSNLLSLCRHIRSPLFLAHVRASTQGEVARANCHPFVCKNWSFMHNGQTGSFLKLRRHLEALLSDEVYALTKGSTDSELIFLLLLNAGLNRDPEQAFARMIRQLYAAAESAKVRPFIRLTCVLSDGKGLYAYRHASDGRNPTLYASKTLVPGGTTIASEPLSQESPDSWVAIEPDRLICFRS